VATEPTAEESVQLTQLNSEYWHRVDHPGKEEVASLYAADGKMVFGEFRLNDRQAIQGFFQARNASVPARTTRHISTNLRFHRIDSRTIQVRSIVSVYAALGDLPLTAGAPTSVLDFEDLCIRSDDRWLYQQRSGTAIFIGPGAAPFLTFQLPPGHPLKTEHSP